MELSNDHAGALVFDRHIQTLPLKPAQRRDNAEAVAALIRNATKAVTNPVTNCPSEASAGTA